MTSIQEWPKGLRALVLALTVVVGSSVLFAAGEVTVRIRHRLKYGNLWGIEDTYTIDPASTLRVPVAGGNFGPIHINSRGFRGPEISQPKPASTVRMAFLGASTTYCGEVSSNEKAWPHIVTESLRRNWPAAQFDYVNAGVPGYGVQDSLKSLRVRVASLQPDVIVIYEGHNDISGIGLELARQQGLATQPTEKTLSWLSKYSLLWYLVEKNLMILNKQRTALRAEGTLQIDRETFAAPFEGDLIELVTASHQVVDLVALVTLSAQLRRDQSPKQKLQASVTSLYYMPYMSADGVIESFESFNDIIRKVARETGALMVENENSIPGTKQYFADSIHFTDEGSRLQAERVSRALMNSTRMREIVNRKTSGATP